MLDVNYGKLIWMLALAIVTIFAAEISLGYLEGKAQYELGFSPPETNLWKMYGYLAAKKEAQEK